MSAAVPLAGGPVVARPVPPWSSSGFLRTSTATTRREPDAVGGAVCAGRPRRARRVWRVAATMPERTACRQGAPTPRRPLRPAARRWRLRHRAGRRTTGRTPAARGRLRPPRPAPGPRPRTGLAAAPGDSRARRSSAVPAARRVPRGLRPRAVGTRLGQASGGALPLWGTPVAPPPAGLGLVAAPTLRAPGVQSRCVGRRALRPGPAPDPPRGGGASTPDDLPPSPDPLQAPGPPCLARPRRGHPLPPVTIPDAEAQGEAPSPLTPRRSSTGWRAARLAGRGPDAGRGLLGAVRPPRPQRAPWSWCPEAALGVAWPPPPGP